MIDDDLDVYFADFGVRCSVNGLEFFGIDDIPDDVFVMDVGRVQSNVKTLTVKSSDIGRCHLAAKTRIVVNQSGFEIVSLSEIDDGEFSILRIKKL